MYTNDDDDDDGDGDDDDDDDDEDDAWGRSNCPRRVIGGWFGCSPGAGNDTGSAITMQIGRGGGRSGGEGLRRRKRSGVMIRDRSTKIYESKKISRWIIAA